MFVSFESVEGWLFFGMNGFDVFVEIGDFFLKLLSFLLKLFDFLIGEKGLIFEFEGIIFFVIDVFFEVIAGIFKVQEMLREVFVLIVLHGISFGVSETLVDKAFHIASPKNGKNVYLMAFSA